MSPSRSSFGTGISDILRRFSREHRLAISVACITYLLFFFAYVALAQEGEATGDASLSLWWIRAPRLLALAGLLFIWFRLLFLVVVGRIRLCFFRFDSTEAMLRILFSVVIFASLAYEAVIFGIQPPIFFFVCVPLFWIIVGLGGLLGGGCTPKPTTPPTTAPGPAPQPTPCCCCAQKLCFQSVTPYNNGTHFGHNLAVLMEMLFKPGSGGTCDCSFEWWEKANITSACIPVAGVWTNAGANCPGTSVFTPWHNRVIPCPQGGTLTIVMNDPPALGVAPGRTATRTLEFRITLKSCPTCGCSDITITGTQTLSIVNGVPQGQGTFTTPNMC